MAKERPNTAGGGGAGCSGGGGTGSGNTNSNKGYEVFSKQHREILAMGQGALGKKTGKSKARITVVVRKRPLTAVEAARHEADILRVSDNKTNVHVDEPRKNVCGVAYIESHDFVFDRSYSENHTNRQVYNSCVKHLVDAVFRQGAWCSCFAYGQTGSGKTYTMIGPSRLSGFMSADVNPAHRGILEMAARDCLKWLTRPEFDYHMGLYVSFFEIYCNKVYDLLNERRLVKALETKTADGVVVKDLVTQKIDSIEGFLHTVGAGLDLRVVGSNSKNLDSSRGHAILTLELKNEHSKLNVGKLAFIDLAGSERGADAMFSGKTTQQDGAGINRSLLALKECIRALDQQSSHVPFRDSELTKVLRDMFIGSKARTLMISCVSPSSACCEQTLNTLRYAERVKSIRRNCRPELAPSDSSTSGGLEGGDDEPAGEEDLSTTTSADWPCRYATGDLDGPNNTTTASSAADGAGTGASLVDEPEDGSGTGGRPAQLIRTQRRGSIQETTSSGVNSTGPSATTLEGLIIRGTSSTRLAPTGGGNISSTYSTAGASTTSGGTRSGTGRGATAGSASVSNGGSSLVATGRGLTRRRGKGTGGSTTGAAAPGISSNGIPAAAGPGSAAAISARQQNGSASLLLKTMQALHRTTSSSNLSSNSSRRSSCSNDSNSSDDSRVVESGRNRHSGQPVFRHRRGGAAGTIDSRKSHMPEPMSRTTVERLSTTKLDSRRQAAAASSSSMGMTPSATTMAPTVTGRSYGSDRKGTSGAEDTWVGRVSKRRVNYETTGKRDESKRNDSKQPFVSLGVSEIPHDANCNSLELKAAVASHRRACGRRRTFTGRGAVGDDAEIGAPDEADEVLDEADQLDSPLSSDIADLGADDDHAHGSCYSGNGPGGPMLRAAASGPKGLARQASSHRRAVDLGCYDGEGLGVLTSDNDEGDEENEADPGDGEDPIGDHRTIGDEIYEEPEDEYERGDDDNDDDDDLRTAIDGTSDYERGGKVTTKGSARQIYNQPTHVLSSPAATVVSNHPGLYYSKTGGPYSSLPSRLSISCFENPSTCSYEPSTTAGSAAGVSGDGSSFTSRKNPDRSSNVWPSSQVSKEAAMSSQVLLVPGLGGIDSRNPNNSTAANVAARASRQPGPSGGADISGGGMPCSSSRVSRDSMPRVSGTTSRSPVNDFPGPGVAGKSLQPRLRNDLRRIFMPKQSDSQRAAAQCLRRRYKELHFPLLPEGCDTPDTAHPVELEIALKMLKGLVELKPAQIQKYLLRLEQIVNSEFAKLFKLHADCLKGQACLSINQQKMLDDVHQRGISKPLADSHGYFENLRNSIESELAIYADLGEVLNEFEGLAALHQHVSNALNQQTTST